VAVRDAAAPERPPEYALLGCWPGLGIRGWGCVKTC